jgi:molecular chaperone DnaK
MSDIVGIDLGTTNSLIGAMEAGFPILFGDADGDRLTPSVVYFPESGQPLVGRAANRMRILRPHETIASVKRLMGSGERFKIHGNDHSPEEISSLILKKLKLDAESALGREVARAVIAVPAYFNDAQRTATKFAGEMAGFSVERIVNEPTAAALAYGLDRLHEKSRIAVYDLGGGTFDISILELNNGVFQVIATHGNTRLGGDDIDRSLLGFLQRRLQVPKADPQFSARLYEAAIAAKHRLTAELQTDISFPFLDGAESVSLSLTRPELEKVARPVVERTRYHCMRSLADAKITAADLDAVILVGGVTRMPLVREFAREVFQREPDISQNPDEAVALGATIQAGILSGALKNMVLLDVTPLSLGIETFGGLMNVIIPRNSTIPLKAGEMFTNALANQRAMLIHVLQGEREMARDNWSLGRFEIEFEPAPKGRARVGVQFEIDADGILHVLARDTKTGAEKVVEIKSAVDVSDEAVEKMIAGSVDHAFEDMSERVWTESKLKAEEMLPSVRNALSLAGDQLAPDEQARIAKLMQDVQAALESQQPQLLKKATAALDEGTQHLATLLVERAMREASQRKTSV